MAWQTILKVNFAYMRHPRLHNTMIIHSVSFIDDLPIRTSRLTPYVQMRYISEFAWQRIPPELRFNVPSPFLNLNTTVRNRVWR